MTSKPEPRYDLTMSLNYYSPYVSGLTDTAKVVAEELAKQGWRVCVVTTRHEKDLPPRETVSGVDVLRTPVLARIGKGVISPQLPIVAARAARASSILNLHMPMLEAGLIARLAAGTPTVATYQCDVALPPGLLNDLQVRGIDASSRAALSRARVVIPSSDDYAHLCRMWSSMQGRTTPVSPPTLDRSGGAPTFRESKGMHVGFLGRIVDEKGLEYLVDGFLAAAAPEDRLLIGGDYQNIAGGSVVEKVRRHAGSDRRIRLLGFLPDAALPDFYASLDVFALPSVNSLEAFGIVQIEAMMVGVPAIASDLPGVRTPVQNTGFGVVVKQRDPISIAQALIQLRDHPLDRKTGAAKTRELYGVERTVAGYEHIFRSLGAAPHC